MKLLISLLVGLCIGFFAGQLFDISFSGDIEKEGRPRFLDLIKEHKSLEINGFVFELNSLETVPCFKSLVSSTN